MHIYYIFSVLIRLTVYILFTSLISLLGLSFEVGSFNVEEWSQLERSTAVFSALVMAFLLEFYTALSK